MKNRKSLAAPPPVCHEHDVDEEQDYGLGHFAFGATASTTTMPCDTQIHYVGYRSQAKCYSSQQAIPRGSLANLKHTLHQIRESRERVCLPPENLNAIFKHVCQIVQGRASSVVSSAAGHGA